MNHRSPRVFVAISIAWFTALLGAVLGLSEAYVVSSQAELTAQLVQAMSEMLQHSADNIMLADGPLSSASVMVVYAFVIPWMLSVMAIALVIGTIVFNYLVWIPYQVFSAILSLLTLGLMLYASWAALDIIQRLWEQINSKEVSE